MTEVELTEDQPGQSPAGTSGRQEQFAFNADAATHQEKLLKLRLGLFGQLIGLGGEKAGNVAGITIMLSLAGILLIGIEVDAGGNPDVFMRLSTPLFSLITLAVGYIFGVGTKERGD